MSSATVPVALVEALEDGASSPAALMLTPAFGARAHVVLARHSLGRPRRRRSATTDVELPPCTQTALEIVKDIIARKTNSSEAMRRINLPG